MSDQQQPPEQDGPSRSPALLAVLPTRGPGVRRLNKIPIGIFVCGACVVVGAIGYTYRDRLKSSATATQANTTKAEGANGASVLNGAPRSGMIESAAFHPFVATRPASTTPQEPPQVVPHQDGHLDPARHGPVMDRRQIIAAVARQTGVTLSPADPILAVVAVNQIMLDQALAQLDQQVRTQADRVTAASTQTVTEATKAAELLLTQGGVWAEAQIKAAGEAAAALVLANLRQEAAKAERASRIATRAAWATVVVGLLMLSGLGGMALAGLAHP